MPMPKTSVIIPGAAQEKEIIESELRADFHQRVTTRGAKQAALLRQAGVPEFFKLPTHPMPEDRAKHRFCQMLAQTHNYSRAVKASGVSRSTIRAWIKKHNKFANAVDAASEWGGDELEQEAFTRALDGTDEPVYYRGKLVGHTTKKSDTLLMFLLKGLKKEKYTERTESKVTQELDLSNIDEWTDEQLARVGKKLGLVK